MPQIPQRLLDCVFFLYHSVEEAEKGEGFGGTGFIVSVTSEKNPKYHHAYGITNWHVAVNQGFSVVRINNRDGTTDIFNFGPEDWQFIPNDYDIAAVALPLDGGKHKFTQLSSSMLVSPEKIIEHKIGVGDDVFMLGRFIDCDGLATNIPAARFGNISINPVSIKMETGSSRPSYCIDLHSRNGYSGSPVIMYRTVGSKIPDPEMGDHLSLKSSYCFLLGVHWGQFPEYWEISDDDKTIENAPAGVIKTEGKYIKGLSGMTCVCPAWGIMELLNINKFIKQRKDDDEREVPDPKGELHAISA